MRTFMWSWKKFIVGVAFDVIPFPPLTQRIQVLSKWDEQVYFVLHLGFLTICLHLGDIHK